MSITLFGFVMVFGALIAVVGLLLLYLRHEQSANTIRVLGQEFQISTPALVVFLAGCGIFSAPLFLPVKDQPVIEFPISRHNGPYGNRSQAIDKAEREDNNEVTSANLISMGTTVKGYLSSENDRDWFKFKVPVSKSADRAPRVRIILRKRPGSGFSAEVVAYSEREEKIKSEIAYGEDPLSFSFDASPESWYYVEVVPHSGQGPYELVLNTE